MCGEDPRLSVGSMINTTHIRPVRTLIGVALAALLLIVALSPPAGQAMASSIVRSLGTAEKATQSVARPIPTAPVSMAA